MYSRSIEICTIYANGAPTCKRLPCQLLYPSSVPKIVLIASREFREVRLQLFREGALVRR